MRPHRILFIIIVVFTAIVSFLTWNEPAPLGALFLEQWDREETPVRVLAQHLKLKTTSWARTLSKRKLMMAKNIESKNLIPSSPLHQSNHSDSPTMAYSNPQRPEIYGWVPDAYPNPILDPTRCGLSFIEKSFSLENNSLRLCDPDRVFGGIYLKDIADALNNFTENFHGHNKPEDKDVAEAMEGDLYGGPIRKLSNKVEVEQYIMRPPTRSLSNENGRVLPPIEIAVAIVRKINLPVVLRQGSFYTYEDEDDMVNDAAQLFARDLHDAWWKSRSDSECEETEDCEDSPEFGILIFLSINDRVCFISTGTGISAVLPWWRLERIVSNMKPDLRQRYYGSAILHAIHDISDMIETGPPTVSDRMHDLLSRFGVVIGFAIFTFLFGIWGEYRDRRKRWEFTENQSRLSKDDKKKARELQLQFHTSTCPICIEPFPDSDKSNLSSSSLASLQEGNGDGMKRVASFVIPAKGPDGRPVKMLRCGHIFCQTCWKLWIDSGNGNPLICPVCRQDVGKPNQLTRELAHPSNDVDASVEVEQQQQQQQSSPSTSLWDNGIFGGGQRQHQENLESTGVSPRETDALLVESSQSHTTNNNVPNYSSTGYFWGITEL